MSNPLNLPDDIFLATWEFGQYMTVLHNVRDKDKYILADAAVLACATETEVITAAYRFGYHNIIPMPCQFKDLQKHCRKMNIRFICDGNGVEPIRSTEELN